MNKKLFEKLLDGEDGFLWIKKDSILSSENKPF